MTHTAAVRGGLALILVTLTVGAASSQVPKIVPVDAKVYIAPMDGFETYIAAALRKKKVPVTVVTDRAMAEYEITGHSESQKAGLGKMIFTGQTGSREEASIQVAHISTSAVVYSYAVNKGNSFKGKQSAAEACAKHLNDHINGKE